MKRFIRRQAADDRQLKMMARADELKSESLHTSTATASATPAVDAEVVTNAATDVGPVLDALRPSLDQMWGLE
jgi:hypothetical protein